jgi:diadenosine tetraphosphatase ApaH/serine/threonine PP2A family protein phosphatase
MHGGISPDLIYLSDIDKIDRYREPTIEGLMCDLLWADPVAKNADDIDYKPGTRGCSQ